ncbi:MAG: T9SS type A sorting domain-containing protein [Saprospiraceae bacterium]|nr:T9SS type A sorting domain-containing protein [Saprospiraceae bacterium]
MQEVAPYTITPYMETDDETGETGEYLSYDGSAVTYMLVNAAQEQQTQIETLNKALEAKTQEIEDLNARLARLEALLSSNNNTNATLSSARLEQNQPNPFNSNTVVRHFIPETVRQAEMRVFDISGKLIKTIIIDGRGEGQTTLQAQTLSAGTYLYSLVLDGQILESKQMVLTKGQ